MLLYTNLYAQQDTLYLSLQQLFERAGGITPPP